MTTQWRRRAGDRGYAAVGVALALPLLFVVIFLAVQALSLIHI